jgi:SAM-dependent methyltransferase
LEKPSPAFLRTAHAERKIQMKSSETIDSVDKDAKQIHEELSQRYAGVARQPAGQFSYPIGRASAEGLHYRQEFLNHLPPTVVDHFVGVGNPFTLGEPEPGLAVLDIGCGAGFDSQVAAWYVGPKGKVIGVDLTEEMLAVARQGVAAAGLRNVEFRQGLAEQLPVESGWADLVISNGVLNLATCKAAAFREVCRVLKPGGRFQAVDLVLVAPLPPELANSAFAWSN